MYIVLGSLILIFAQSSLSSSLPQKRIVNGTNADVGEFPYIVSLRRNSAGVHTCGCSIISPEWILTAAHCIALYHANELTIQYGVTEVSGKSPNIAKVSKMIVHQKYEQYDNYVNDIALLQLKEPLKYDKFTQPIKLPAKGYEVPGGRPAVLAGWGRNDTKGVSQKYLKKVDLITFSDEDCNKRNDGKTYPTNICAGVPEGGKGQCSGDSGGPLVVDDLQVGIVSWSLRPCASKPGIFTKVASYIDWINENTGLKF